MENKRILVTGSAGYVGSTLARLLIQKNFDVTLIDNYFVPSNIKQVEGIPIVKKDIRDYNVNPAQYDVIFHLAAISGIHTCEEAEVMAHSINVGGTLHLLRDFKGKFIFASSSAVYGICQEPLITEGHPVHPRSVYGATKLYAEQVVKLHGNHVILRFSNIYGRGIFNKRTVTDAFIDKAIAKKPLEIHGDGLQRRDFVHINDVLIAYWNAMRTTTTGTFNIGGNEALSINDIAELVVKNYRKAFGITLEVKHILQDSGVAWKDFVYSSERAKKFICYEPNYSVNDEVRERFNAEKRKRT